VLFVLLLLTRREYEMAAGSETNGPVDWARAVYERVREFGLLLSAGGLPQPFRRTTKNS